MKLQIKPKSYGPVYINVNQEGKLAFSQNPDQFDQSNPDISSPAISLLYSLGGCIALSLQMVAEKRKLTLKPFCVKASSGKALDLPFRFENFQVRVSEGFVDDTELAQKLLKDAKSICTVSNTLNTDVDLSLGEISPNQD